MPPSPQPGRGFAGESPRLRRRSPPGAGPPRRENGGRPGLEARRGFRRAARQRGGGVPGRAPGRGAPPGAGERQAPADPRARAASRARPATRSGATPLEARSDVAAGLSGLAGRAPARAWRRDGRPERRGADRRSRFDSPDEAQAASRDVRDRPRTDRSTLRSRGPDRERVRGEVAPGEVLSIDRAVDLRQIERRGPSRHAEDARRLLRDRDDRADAARRRASGHGLGASAGTATSTSSARPAEQHVARRPADDPDGDPALPADAGRAPERRPSKQPGREWPISFGETAGMFARTFGILMRESSLQSFEWPRNRRAVTLGSRPEGGASSRGCRVPEEELSLWTEQLGRIVSYIDQIARIPEIAVGRAAEALPPTPVRPDEPRPGLRPRGARGATPRAGSRDYGVVPRVSAAASDGRAAAPHRRSEVAAGAARPSRWPPRRSAGSAGSIRILTAVPRGLDASGALEEAGEVDRRVAAGETAAACGRAPRRQGQHLGRRAAASPARRGSSRDFGRPATRPPSAACARRAPSSSARRTSTSSRWALRRRTARFRSTRNPWDRRASRVALREAAPRPSPRASSRARSARTPAARSGSPAACCGVVGFKPTYGRVSRYGLVAFGSSLDQIGPLTRDVSDAARLYAVIAGRDPHDSTSSRRGPSGTRRRARARDRGTAVGFLAERPRSEGLDPRVAENLEACRRGVRSAPGARDRDVSVPRATAAIAIYYVVASAEASSNLARYDGVRYGPRRLGGGSRLALRRDAHARLRRGGQAADPARHVRARLGLLRGLLRPRHARAARCSRTTSSGPSTASTSSCARRFRRRRFGSARRSTIRCRCTSPTSSRCPASLDRAAGDLGAVRADAGRSAARPADHGAPLSGRIGSSPRRARSNGRSNSPRRRRRGDPPVLTMDPEPRPASPKRAAARTWLAASLAVGRRSCCAARRRRRRRSSSLRRSA